MDMVESNKIIGIVKMARKVGEAAGRKRFKELRENGYKWKVVNDGDGKVVGHMLDVCGFASLSVPGKGKVVRAFKKIGEYDRRMDGYVVDGMEIWKSSRGYALSIISTGRQEMSVNEVAVGAASGYLNENNLECSWNSRID